MKIFAVMVRSILPIALLALGACANYDTRLNSSATSYLGTNGSIVSNQTQASVAESKSYWDGDDLIGPPSIVIDLNRQTASFYKGDKLAGVSAISSGREEYKTPTGRFKITQKNPDHASNLYGDYVDAAGNVVQQNVSVKTDPCPPGATFRGAPMPYFMRVVGGVGMHQGFLPGVPDSHGCIRMPEKMVKIFFANAPQGTPVTIIN